MSTNDELTTYEVDTSDSKISKLEVILNQARVGFYALLGGTMATFGYGIFAGDEVALNTGQQLLTPIVAWMFMYVGIIIGKKDPE